MALAREADLIVVGSGIAGLAAALAAAEEGGRVALVTAGSALSGSSWWAQGGIAAAIGEDDSTASHLDDTVAVGAGLNDRHAVNVLVREGRSEIMRLVREGVPFDSGPSGPHLGLEAGHRHRRILHGNGGATGEMVSAALFDRAVRHPLVTVVPETPVDRLIVEDGRVAGVASGEDEYRGRAVVLATGGYAGLWGRSTNPPGNRGMGLYLAWSAGAALADLEFVQFHPTALSLPGAPAFLLSEALRGEGAQLVDAQGLAFVNPLLARDVVARAIARHMATEGPVFLSMRHLDAARTEERFSAISQQLRAYGLDLTRDPIPVAPAAHYCMGGVRTDTYGRSDVAGLYAAGEAGCTGAQGANRLASNSLLECLVSGHRAAQAALKDGQTARAGRQLRELPCGRPNFDELSNNGQQHAPAALGSMLDRHLGVERNDRDLRALLASLPNPDAGQAPADHTIAALAARAALLRTESRGAHYRTDARETLPEWQGRILWRRGTPPQFEEVPSC